MSNCTNNFIKRVIGVTRTFQWTITTNGAAVPLVADDLTLHLVPPRGEAVSLPFDVDDNVVSFTWQGEDQHIIGCYSLILWANYGEDNQRRVDIHNFVELIPWSDRQSGEYSDLVEETIELETADFGENIMVVDNLNSTSATDALSANMGRQLNVTKQDVIADLATIRSGAAAGAAVKEWAKNDPLITDDATQVSASKLAFNGNIFEQWVPGIASSIGLKGIAGFLKVADISQWDSAYNDRMLPTVAAVKAKLQAVLTALATIEAVIPSQASSTNKLTDKGYVDGAIATNTANFVGTFDTLAELQAVQNPTKNDYGFVIETDAQGNEYYDRYKYTGTQWLYEYKVESTPFTAEQWAAIQSGITAALVSKLSALPTNAELNTALASKQPVINDLTTIRSGAAAGATAYQKPSGGIPKTDLASAVQASLGKADAALSRNDMATVNGSDLTHGGNVTIVAAEGQTITIDAAPTAGSSNAVSSGGVYDALAYAGVYDVSAHNSGDTFASLSALLSDANLATLIPTAARKGGMSIKFVLTSDNKYVQYFLTKNEWSASESDWEKMNLEEEVGNIADKFIKIGDLLSVVSTAAGWYLKGDGLCGQNSNAQMRKFQVVAGERIYLKLSKDTEGVYQFQSSSSVPSSGTNSSLVGAPVSSAIDGFVVVPQGATYLIVSELKSNSTNQVKSTSAYSLQNLENEINIEGQTLDIINSKIDGVLFDYTTPSLQQGYTIVGEVKLYGGKQYHISLTSSYSNNQISFALVDKISGTSIFSFTEDPSTSQEVTKCKDFIPSQDYEAYVRLYVSGARNSRVLISVENHEYVYNNLERKCDKAEIYGKVGGLFTNFKWKYNAYISSSGSVVSSSDLKYSIPILIHKGDVVKVIGGGSGISAISKAQQNNGDWIFTVLVPMTSATPTEYTYTAEEDMYVSVSGRCNRNDGTSIAASIIYLGDINEEINGVKQSKNYNNAIKSTLQGAGSYYFTPLQSPATFDDTNYVDKFCNSIPEGKHFIFLTDTHWVSPYNSKKCNKIIAYLRAKLGIEKVLFGGDILTVDRSKYLANQVLNEYLEDSYLSFQKDYIPCLGNHDINNANIETIYPDIANNPEIYIVPYSRLYELFVKQQTDAICYTPTNKVSALYPDTTSDGYKNLLAKMKLNYHIDDNKNKIRYIVFDTGCPQIGNIAAELFDCYGMGEVRLVLYWLVNALKTTPEGYDIVLLCHQPFQLTAIRTGDEGEQVVTDFSIPSSQPATSTTLFKLFGALRNKTSIHQWIQLTGTDTQKANLCTWLNASLGTSSTYIDLDFTGANNVGKIIVMCGHFHYDAIVYCDPSSPSNVIKWDGEETIDNAAGQVPFFAMASDMIDSDIDRSRAVGTVEEDSINVITLTENGVHISRFGYESVTMPSNKTVTFAETDN